jgi:hypothetical protein
MSHQKDTNTFLRYWNPGNDPSHPDYSCYLALESFFYCLGPGNQWRSFYRKGHVTGCTEQRNDLSLCWRVKAMHNSGREEEALRTLEDAKIPKPKPHIWRFRKTPPTGPWVTNNNPPTQSPSSSS